MHPEDDPWSAAYPHYVTCHNCGLTYKDEVTFKYHYCTRAYSEKWPDPPRPLVDVIPEAQIEETREDLLALLDELS